MRTHRTYEVFLFILRVLSLDSPGDKLLRNDATVSLIESAPSDITIQSKSEKSRADRARGRLLMADRREFLKDCAAASAGLLFGGSAAAHAAPGASQTAARGKRWEVMVGGQRVRTI